MCVRGEGVLEVDCLYVWEEKECWKLIVFVCETETVRGLGVLEANSLCV